MLKLLGLTPAAYRDTLEYLSTAAPPAHDGAPAGCDEPLIFSASSRSSTGCLAWPGLSRTDLSSRRSWELRRAFSLTRPGLMVVTSAGLREGRGHREVAAAAISGGADAVQLRAPELSDRDLLPLAVDLASACREAGRLLIVNNRLEVAVAAGADGVHLGQDDEPDRARALLPPGMVLGVSVGNPEQARWAARFGASYLGVTVWATATKPGARPAGLAGLRAVCAATSLPVAGIGGIDPGNAAKVLAAGACGVAVVSAVGAAPDMVAATRALAAVLERFRAIGAPASGATGAAG